MSVSPSASSRQRGNMYYQQAKDEPQNAGAHLDLAVRLYGRALDEAMKASNRRDAASAHKNLAAAMRQVATLSSQGMQGVETLVGALQHASSALAQGQVAQMPEPWLQAALADAKATTGQLSEAALLSLGSPPMGQNIASALLRLRCALLEAPAPAAVLTDYHARLLITLALGAAKTIQHQPPPRASARGQSAGMGTASASSSSSTSAAAASGWRLGLHLVQEAQQPLHEGLQLAVECLDETGAMQLQEAESLLAETASCCQSMQARQQADELVCRIKESRTGREEKLDGVLMALDLYRQAALLASGQGPDAKHPKAHALSCMASCYMSFSTTLDPHLRGQHAAAAAGTPPRLGAKARALQLYLQVVRLVEELPHKTYLLEEAWYKAARDAVAEQQRSASYEEERQRAAWRDAVKEDLKEELVALYKSASNGWVELLKHVYKEHPPHKPEHRLAAGEKFEATRGKALLRDALLHYHPDKQAGQPYKWQVLCEHITKELSVKYEYYK